MATLTRPKTYLDLEDPAQCPDDGRRYEVIYGELYVSAAPDRRHQKLSVILTVRLFRLANETGAGEVYAAPVDVRLLGTDQVQPDLIFIRAERLHLYQGHVVFGPPDLVIEILSPSTRNVDLGTKQRFYAEAGVPEYWIFDPGGAVRPFRLIDAAYVAIEPEADGTLRSRVLPTFVVDPIELSEALDS
jgi:Uma2 family endonuclease